VSITLRAGRRARAWNVGLGLWLALAAAPWVARLAAYPYLVDIADRAALTAAAAISLQFLVGVAGLVSLGHAAFLGIGGYAALAFAVGGANEAALSLPAAVIGAASFAALTGLLALRTRGVTFIMITLAFAQMAYFIAQSFELFGGSDGMPLDPPALLGTGLLRSPAALHGIALLALAACLVGAPRLTRSRFGRVLRAGTESPARVIAAGFDLRAVRLRAYVLSGAAAGAIGWLLAEHAGFVSPAMMEWRVSGELLVMVILGGTRTPEGAGLGAVGLVAAEEVLAAFTDHWRLLLAPVLILIALRFGPRRP